MRYDSDSHEGSTRPVRCVWNGGAAERELLFNACRLVFFLLDSVLVSGTRRRGPPGRTRSGPGEGRLPAPEVSGCPAGITGRRRAPPCAGAGGGRLCPAGAAASPALEAAEEDGRYGEGAWATIGKKQVLDNGAIVRVKIMLIYKEAWLPEKIVGPPAQAGRLENRASKDAQEMQ